MYKNRKKILSNPYNFGLRNVSFLTNLTYLPIGIGGHRGLQHAADCTALPRAADASAGQTRRAARQCGRPPGQAGGCRPDYSDQRVRYRYRGINQICLTYLERN